MEKTKVFYSNKKNGIFIEHVRRGKPYYMENKHFHTQYEIYYLLYGDRNYFIQDRVFNVQKGDLILINSNALHKTVDGSSDFHERILIEFDPGFFDGFLVDHMHQQILTMFVEDSNIFRLKDTERKQIENCLFRIIQECKENGIEDNIALKVYFLELLITMNKFNSKETIKVIDHPNNIHKRISEIITFISLNYKSDIGLEYIADKFFLSTAHLSRSFKKVTGFTFIEYLNSLRVHEARKLLTESILSISDIAKEVGYQNSTHFGRMFKSITGNSPRDYRNMMSLINN